MEKDVHLRSCEDHTRDRRLLHPIGGAYELDDRLETETLIPFCKKEIDDFRPHRLSHRHAEGGVQRKLLRVPGSIREFEQVRIE